MPRPLRPLLLGGVTILLLGCSSEPPTRPSGTPPPSPPLPFVLQNLSSGDAHDRNGNPQPVAPLTGSGTLRGTVLGPALPGSGADSLDTAPRLDGSRVTAYPVLSVGLPIELGPVAASTLTENGGRFILGGLPAGEYIVTVEPQNSALYRGQWIRGTAHESTMQHSWWVVLATR